MSFSKFKKQVKSISKEIIYESSYNLGWSRRIVTRKANAFKLILTYHNVLPEGEMTPHYSNNVDITIAAFEFQIKTLKDHFGIQPARKLNDGNQNGIFISFDDGMLNNIEIVEPILAKYDVTAMFGICSGLVDGSIDFIWRDYLFLILNELKGKNILLSDLPSISGKEVNDSNLDFLANAITQYIESNEQMDHVYDYLSKLAKYNNIAISRKDVPQLRYTPMGIPDIQNLNHKGHLIASHTHSHRKLSMLSEKELEYEMKKSRSFLMDIIGSCDTLVYPYGSAKEVNDRVGESAGDGGFKYAYMNIPTDNPNSQFFIPRLNMRNVATKSEYLGLLAGINKII